MMMHVPVRWVSSMSITTTIITVDIYALALAFGHGIVKKKYCLDSGFAISPPEGSSKDE